MYEEKIFETDDPRWIECERAVARTMNAEIDAAVVLVDVRPTTQAGICALLQYAHATDTDGEAWPRELQSDDGKITRSWRYFLIESVAGALANLSAARIATFLQSDTPEPAKAPVVTLVRPRPDLSA